MHLIDELKLRGLIFDIVNEEELKTEMNKNPITLYCGFDPTADSLHIGSLLPIVTLLRFRKAGHNVIALVGGGTGLVGDPSGKKNERQMQGVRVIKDWAVEFENLFKRFFKIDNKTAFCLNNYTWLSKMNFIDVLRDYGQHFSINYMLAKESIKSRLENGLSYLEFSYMMLQSIDFLTMYQDEKVKCNMQIGGQDQWGNITAGLELIRRVEGSEAKAYGLTMPLIVKSDGSKFGKTETGTIWLEEEKTSAYEMYQFFINTADNDVIKYLKYYTFLSLEKIIEIEKEWSLNKHLRLAQKILASELVSMVHGKNKLNEAIKITEVLFEGNIKKLSVEEIKLAFKGFALYKINEGIKLLDLLKEINIASSNREAREFINNKAISLNGEIVLDENYLINKDITINNIIILRRGKKIYYQVEVV